MRTKAFIMMAAAALAMAGCSNDDENDNWAGEIRLSSGLTVQQTDTRAATDIQNAQFDNGENIDVFINENTTVEQTASTTYTQPLVYTADGKGNMEALDNNQPYFPASDNGVNIHAYYPSGKVSSIAAGVEDITFSVESDQSGSTDENYKKSDLMYGKPAQNPVNRTSSQIPLHFTHLLSKVIITLEAGKGTPSLDGAVVRLKSVQPSTTLTPSTGAISEASGTATDIIVMTALSLELSGSAIVVPQTLATNFIEITLADGGKLTSKDLKDSSDNPITSVVFTSGNVYTYTIKVNLTGLKVTSTITQWNGNETHSGEAEMQ